MDIWDINKLTIFIAFVMPGFIVLKIYSTLEPSGKQDASQQLIDAVAYSSLNYAIWLWPILEIEQRNIKTICFTYYALFYAFIVFASPVIMALSWWWLRCQSPLTSFFPHPTQRPWDYVFRQCKPYWMIITLKNGSKVGGRYDSKSFASHAPSPEQLYLEQTWHINGDDGFERPKNDSAGMIISASEVIMVELVNIQDDNGEDDDNTKAATT